MPRDEMSSWNPADVETWHRLVQKIVKFQCNLAEQDILLPATFNIFYSNKIQDFLKERGVCWCTHESASSYTLIVKAVLPLHDILSDFARDSFESWKKSMPQSIASCFSVVSQHCVKMQKKVDRTPPEELICTSAVIFTDPIMKKSKMATVVFLAGLLEDHAELNDMAQWFFDNKAQRVIVVYASEDRDELERTKALPESKYRIASLLQEFGNDRSKALLPELMGEIQTNVVPYTPISKDEAEMEQEISNQISLKVQTEDWVGPCKFWIEYVGSGNMMDIEGLASMPTASKLDPIDRYDLIPRHLRKYYKDLDELKALELDPKILHIFLQESPIKLAWRRAIGFLRPPELPPGWI